MIKLGLYRITGTGGVEITGLGFQPTFVKFWTFINPSDIIDTGTNDNGWYDSVGYANGTWQYAHCANAKITSKYSGRISVNTHCIYAATVTADGASTTDLSATLDSMDADGFTFNVDTYTSRQWIAYMAMDSIETVHHGSIQVPSSNSLVNYTACGFSPNLMFLDALNNFTEWNAALTSTQISHGDYCKSHDSLQNLSTTGGVTGYATGAVDTARSTRYQINGTIKIRTFTSASPVVIWNIASMGTASGDSIIPNGYQLNWTNTNIFDKYHYITSIKGINAVAGVQAAKTSTGTQSITGVGFQPEVVLFMSNGTTSSPVVVREMVLCYGAADGTTQWGDWKKFTDNDLFAGPAPASSLSMTHCLHLGGLSGGGATSATLQSMDSDGFTLNYDVADGTAYSFRWLALKSKRYSGGGQIITGKP